jgi:hypothetical protein
MGGMMGIIGNQNPPLLIGVAAAKTGTPGVISSSGGGSAGVSTGSSGNLYSKTGTSTGVFSTFSGGSFGRIGNIGTAQ